MAATRCDARFFQAVLYNGDIRQPLRQPALQDVGVLGGHREGARAFLDHVREAVGRSALVAVLDRRVLRQRGTYGRHARRQLRSIAGTRVGRDELEAVQQGLPSPRS